jgi:hypothetical protein
MTMLFFQPSQITAPATQNEHVVQGKRHNSEKNTLVTHQKMRNSARLPAKMHMAFFSPSQNTASATQNGRAQSHSWPQVEMHIFQLKN